MRVLRCGAEDITLAMEAVSTVKAEEDAVLTCETAIKSFMSSGFNYFLVAVEENCVVGYAIAYQLNRIDGAGDMMCLYEIGVLRENRKRGIGSALINELKAICRGNGFSKMWVSTNRSNIGACALYEKTGGVAAKEADEIIYTYRF